MPPPRPRWVYALACAVTIALGLGSRVALPHVKDVGDALYATLIVFAVALVAPRTRPWLAAVIALAWCFAIEASQRYRAPWLDAVRATLPGRLVLGQGFHAFDLVDYVVGAALGFGVRARLDHRRYG